jgi:Ca2+-binding EF-hand superfamily protein
MVKMNFFIIYLFIFVILGDGFIQYKEFREYFGDDLLTSEASVVELTTLFKEIDIDHSGTITLDQLLTFFNQHSPMITKEEAHIFLGMVSDIGNENSISLKGMNRSSQ